MLKKVLILSLILFISINASESKPTLSQKGTKWYGLDLGFKSVSGLGSGYNLNTITLNSVTRFFPGDNFVLGPNYQFFRLSFGELGDREFVHIHDFGLEIGYCGNIKEKVVPYFLLRPTFSLLTMGGYGDWYGEPDFKAEAKLGCLVFLNDIVGVQIEPNYTIQPLYEMGTFGINIGFAFRLDKRMFSLATKSTSPMDTIWWW